MIVAIIFAILSVFVIVFTVIYLNKQNQIKSNIQKRKGKKNLKNLWEIDDIKDEIIVSGNKNTIIMRIGSIDYHLLSEKEQNALEMNLIEIAKTIKYPLQFFSTTEFIDTTEVIKDIKQTISEKDSDEILRLAAYAECYSTHPISKSLVEAWEKQAGRSVDQSLVSNVEEISGHGLRAMVENRQVEIAG